jgi:hypothetical protein
VAGVAIHETSDVFATALRGGSGIGCKNGLATLTHYTQIKSIYVELGDVECPYA